MGIDEIGGDPVGGEIGMRQNGLNEGNIGGNTGDAKFTQGARRLLHDIRPACGRRMNDDLGEQGVEGRTCLVSGIAERIDPHPGAGRRIEHPERPARRLRHALLVHHLHVDAKLHRVAAGRRHCGLGQAERGQGRAGGNRQLRFHEVDAEHLLGHGMLDLQARIGLDEGECGLSACVAVDQELKRAQIVVMRGDRELLGGLDNARAQGIAQRGARRHLDELLVAPLNRAFALPQMAGRAVMIGDDLHFDMAGLADQALDIDLIVSEGGLRLGLAACIGFLQPCGILDDAHAAPAAASHRLDHGRATGAERAEECPRLLQRGRAAGAFDHRQAAAPGQSLGLDLVAEQFERIRRRPDEDDALLRTAPRQRGVLAEKAVAGMQRIASGRLRGRDHRFDIEIGPRAPPRNLTGFVGGADMQRQGVVGRVDGDGGQAALSGGAGDANGDFTAIGDQ